MSHKAVRPNAGIREEYRRALLRLVDQMARSYARWLRATWRANPPKMAMDASPARDLQRELRRLGARWQGRIDEAAPRLARWFAQKASRRSEAALRAILRDAGISVPFRATPAMRDVFAATIQENVSLIRSIPAQFHQQVEGMVMRSVATGRDLEQLTRDLEQRFRVTRDRAELIARDQNNKATSALMKARQVEMGIKKGVWLHSHGGKEPRPTHLANHGKPFDVAAGWFDPDPRVRRRIMPGELINCRCVWAPVVEGFS